MTNIKHKINSYTKEILQSQQSAAKLFSILIITIFLSEVFVMLFLHLLPVAFHEVEIILDPLLLILITFPVLYYLVFLPLKLHIGAIERTKCELEEIKENLEIRVRERTEDLERDIARRKQLEKKLLKSEEFQQTVMDAIQDPLIVIDHNYNVLLTNQAARKTTSGKDPAACGMKCHQLSHHRDTPCEGLNDPCPMTIVMKEKKPTTVFHTHYLPDESKTFVEVTGWPIFNDSGEVVQVIEHCRDITERKQAEEKLEDLNKQLQEASLQAGMAQMATGVLHNVGNVLNSVNVSASLLVEKINKSKLAGLNKVKEMINQHTEDFSNFISQDEKGKLLPDYIIKLADHLTEEQALNLTELETLKKTIDHIKEIIHAQQSYARSGGVTEPASVVDIIEDALYINKASLERHAIQVVREFSETPVIQIEKHKVIQIMTNLIRNAKQAMTISKQIEKILTLRVSLNGNDCIYIEVNDNGIGISEENITKIFAHGFTTRKDGHGFGLHTASLAAKEMGGTLTVHSDGPEKGATFTLELPVTKPDN